MFIYKVFKILSSREKYFYNKNKVIEPFETLYEDLNNDLFYSLLFALVDLCKYEFYSFICVFFYDKPLL